jgi:hypothetical protein
LQHFEIFDELLAGAGQLCHPAQRRMAPTAPRVQNTQPDQSCTKSP